MSFKFRFVLFKAVIIVFRMALLVGVGRVCLSGANGVHGLDAVLRADFSDSVEVNGIAAKR